jgi:gliding motility-associated-like protein
MNYRLLFLFLCISIFQLNAQNIPKQWVFSHHAGINFNTEPPISFITAIDAADGSACATDSNGNILFYTDGVTVYTNDHQIMENGDSLHGNFSSSQSALILKAPGINSLFYIFTTEGFQAYKAEPQYGLSYSTVDMSLNKNKGKIVKKNIELIRRSCENITAVKHSNNRDFWLISHSYNNDSLLSFLISDSGINLKPVVSRTGFIRKDTKSFFQYNGTGYLKANRDGNLIAKTYIDLNNTNDASQNAVILFNYDKQTGKAKYFMTILLSNKEFPSGIEFSLSGRYLYIGNYMLINPGITQYDLFLNDTNEILKSKYFISTGAPDNFHYLGGMAMGPDGKLYFVQSHSYDSFVGCIPFPDFKAPKCGLNEKAIKLQSGSAIVYGFINISQAVYDKPFITLKGKCAPGEFTLSANTYEQDSINWFIKDSFIVHSIRNNVQVMIKNSGKKTIRAIVYYKIGCDTLSVIYNFQSPPQISLPEDTILCSGDIISIKATSNLNRVIWSTGDTTKNINISFPGKFIATATNNIGCTANDSIIITQPQKPITEFNIKPFCENIPAIVTVQPTNLLSNYNLTWSSGDKDNLSTKYFLERNEFLTLIDSNKCSFTDTFLIRELCEPSLFTPNAFSPNGDGLNDVFLPNGKFINEYTLQIYNRWGEKIYECNDLYSGWDGIFKGKSVPEGVYIYFINAKGENGKDISLKGSVMLLR